MPAKAGIQWYYSHIKLIAICKNPNNHLVLPTYKKSENPI